MRCLHRARVFKTERQFPRFGAIQRCAAAFFPVYWLVDQLGLRVQRRWRAPAAASSERAAGSSGTRRLKTSLRTDIAGELEQINLGWLYLNVLAEKETALEKWAGEQAALPPDLAPIFPRLAIVSDALFSNIVDDQLEVRTSVSISPETGAAEPGALYTEEALPRSSILLFQVTVLNPSHFRLPWGRGRIQQKMDDIHRTVFAGLELIEFLGVGGVNTRGMGRLKVLRGAENKMQRLDLECAQAAAGLSDFFPRRRKANRGCWRGAGFAGSLCVRGIPTRAREERREGGRDSTRRCGSLVAFLEPKGPSPAELRDEEVVRLVQSFAADLPKLLLAKRMVARFLPI